MQKASNYCLISRAYFVYFATVDIFQRTASKTRKHQLQQCFAFKTTAAYFHIQAQEEQKCIWGIHFDIVSISVTRNFIEPNSDEIAPERFSSA